MTYEPFDPPANPLPKKSVLPAVLRSPSGTEVHDTLAAFVPTHARYDEPSFLRMLQAWLEKHGPGLSYTLKDSVLKARRQVHKRTAQR